MAQMMLAGQRGFLQEIRRWAVLPLRRLRLAAARHQCPQRRHGLKLQPLPANLFLKLRLLVFSVANDGRRLTAGDPMTGSRFFRHLIIKA